MDHDTTLSTPHGDQESPRPDHSGPCHSGAAGGIAGPAVRLCSPGSVIASIPLMFGFHPENSLVVLGLNRTVGRERVQHGVRIGLDQVRGREREIAADLVVRLRDHDADEALLIAFAPRGATGPKARPDHCRKLMAAMKTQLAAGPAEDTITVADAIFTSGGRWWSYMCRNKRCCPVGGTMVPTEPPPALVAMFAGQGPVFASREAMDATFAPCGVTAARRMKAALRKAAAEAVGYVRPGGGAGHGGGARHGGGVGVGDGVGEGAPAGRDGGRPMVASSGGEGDGGVGDGESIGQPSGMADGGFVGAPGGDGGRGVPAGGGGPFAGVTDSASDGASGWTDEAVRRAHRLADRLLARCAGGSIDLSDAEAAELLVGMVDEWRVRDYLACVAFEEERAALLLCLMTEVARRAPDSAWRTTPLSLAAWAAWALGRTALAQCAVDRALAADPDYHFALLIRAGLHYGISSEAVRASADNTRRALFPDEILPTRPKQAPGPAPAVPAQRHQPNTEEARS
jgi:hypothetical protein